MLDSFDTNFEDLKDLIKTEISKAEILILGESLEILGDDPVNKLVRAFSELISRVYPNLRMIKGSVYKEFDIHTYLYESGATLLGNNAIQGSDAEDEILSTITGNNLKGLRTTVKGLLDKFEKKPYGWYYSAILCTLARVIARGKVEVRQNSSILDSEELLIPMVYMTN